MLVSVSGKFWLQIAGFQIQVCIFGCGGGDGHGGGQHGGGLPCGRRCEVLYHCAYNLSSSCTGLKNFTLVSSFYSRETGGEEVSRKMGEEREECMWRGEMLIS